MKSYEIAIPETGEIKSKYLYFDGMPKEYRFDARIGQFNLNGTKPLLDKKGSPIKSFTFQPVAYRFFAAQMFGRERIEKWIEVFFADEKNHVSVIMFSGTNVEPFENLIRTECLYEGLELTDLVITATPKQVTSKADPQKSWYIVELSSDNAKEEDIVALRDFDKDRKIFNKDTVKDGAIVGIVKSTYFEELMLVSDEVGQIAENVES